MWVGIIDEVLIGLHVLHTKLTGTVMDISLKTLRVLLVELPTVRIFFPDCPDFNFPVRNTHSGREKSGNSTTLGTFNISHYNFM
jgi:hypothetical protein